MININKLVQVCTVRKYRSQTIIFKEGDLGTEMFIILSGRVRVFISASNDNKVEIAELKAGDIFGEMSLLDRHPRSATVEALEETTTISVDENNFESVIRQEPSLALRILKKLSERIRLQNAELAKYKDQVCIDSQLIENRPQVDTDPQIAKETLTTIVEIGENHQLGNISECDDFKTLIQHFEKYNLMELPNHSEYLFTKRIPCPICDQTIEVKHVRSSKLRLKQVDPDYRQVYENFEPLWYNVWVCPYCYYANFSTEFESISDRERKRFKEVSSKAKDIFGSYYLGPLSQIQILAGYYTMLYWFQLSKTPSPDFEELGKIWLRLSWLFEDFKEIELSIAAAKKALDNFISLLNDTTVKTTVAQEQYLYLLVGELNLKIGNISEAKTYFRQSFVIKGGNERMKQQAQNRIRELS